MSRKLILRIVASLAVAATLGSTAADARGFGGGSFGGGRVASASFAGRGATSSVGRGSGGSVGLVPILNPGRGNNPGGGNPGGGPIRPIFPPGGGGPIHPILPPGGGHWVHWHHHHWIWRDGIWVDLGLDDVADAPLEEAPGPCTCLTKTYTQDGLVVFADVCTKEAASARVDGSAAAATPVPPAPGKSSDATPVPPADTTDVSKAPTSQNYAGRTFQDFLAANQQAAKN
jgi:hypothetical protein